jgi:hypothetical protein
MFLDEYQLIKRLLNRICIVLVAELIMITLLFIAVVLS